MATTQQPYRAVVLAGGADRLTGGYGVHNALQGPLALLALPWSWYSCTLPWSWPARPTGCCDRRLRVHGPLRAQPDGPGGTKKATQASR